jgi:hypothetical protein
VTDGIHAKTAIDLDELEELCDRYYDFVGVKTPQLRSLIAELRASRKVVEAAVRLHDDADLVDDTLYAVHADRFKALLVVE